jgi:hypothetical protein
MFIVDNETELDIGWPVGTKVYCKDTSKVYHLINGVFRLIGPGSGAGAAWGDITGTLSAQTDLQGELNAKTTLTAVKADTDIADAITKKHSQNTDTGTSAANFAISGNNAIKEGDSRLTDARTPNSHDNTYHSVAFASDSEFDTHVALTTAAHGGILAFSGLSKISVGTQQPTTPSVGDLWVDTN